MVEPLRSLLTELSNTSLSTIQVIMVTSLGLFGFYNLKSCARQQQPSQIKQISQTASSPCSARYDHNSMYYNYIEFGLFSLFLQVLKKQPGLFLQTSLPSSALLCRAISCLSMPEQHPVKSVASFLTHLVNTSRSTIRTSTQSNISFQGS